MTQKEVNQAEWEAPGNWHGGWLWIYHSERDSRVWVPKRVPWMGWTVNLAHRGGKFFLGSILLFVLVATLMGYLADR